MAKAPAKLSNKTTSLSSQFLNAKKALPDLGVGLGLRRELAVDIFNNANKIDCLEFVPENYMGIGGAARERLEKALSVKDFCGGNN